MNRCEASLSEGTIDPGDKRRDDRKPRLRLSSPTNEVAACLGLR
jgi:hypothetical protein